MMGARIGGQDRLFQEFGLDDIVPADHLLRRIDAAFDLDRTGLQSADLSTEALAKDEADFRTA